MQNLGNMKTLKLLQRFEDDGLTPLRNMYDDPDVSEQRKKDIEPRIELYQELINTFQKLALTHVHYYLGVLALHKRMVEANIIDKDGDVHFETSELSNEEFAVVCEPLFNLLKYYEIVDGKVVPKESDEIVEFISRLNDEDINVTVI